MDGVRAMAAHIGLYAKALAKWLILAVFVGAVCGGVGAAFHIGVHEATALRGRFPWLLWCLPLAGVGIVGFYKLTHTEGQGTNDIIDEVRSGTGLSIWLLPAIFLGTMLTHLCGGSAGREGAALQMGGTIGYHAGRLFRMDDQDLRVATMSGMAAFFSALFGTPLAATVFAIVVISVGVMYHAALIPCLTAALTAYGVSLWMGVEPSRFIVEMPALEAGMLIRVAVLAALCALVSAVFCGVLHVAERQMRRYLPNPWLRAAVGGAAVIALTFLCGVTDYNGAGMEVITAAVEQGRCRPEAFLWKIVFTALTLSAGFKGGEIVPTLCVGAAFGCAFGQITGFAPSLCAACSMAAFFAGVTNCPIYSLVIALELFGYEGMEYFSIAIAVAFALSGYYGLYASQKFVYSKTKTEFINRKSNK